MIKPISFILCAFILSCAKIPPPETNKLYDFFPEAIEYVFESEGFYSNHISDLGGETKYGISRRSYPTLDIKNLTAAEAKQIYYTDFWKKYNLDKIHSKELAIKLFDTMVLVGARKATLLLEESLTKLGFKIPIDGIFDPEVMNIINTLPTTETLIDIFQMEMERFFHEIVKVRPSQKVFLIGWLNRARREKET